MNSDFKFYLALLFKRLPVMIVMLLLGAGIGLGLALTLPPTFQADARLTVENSSIALGTTTRLTSAEQQLKLIEERLMTRANMIDVAHKFQVFDDVSELKPDVIFKRMADMTGIEVLPGDRVSATRMAIWFEADDPQTAADVVNEFVTLVESESAVISQREASGTAEFYESEVKRLNEELGRKSANIVAFKEANKDALPEEQDYRLNRQTQLQERLSTKLGDRSLRIEQRNRLMAVGTAPGVQNVQLTPKQQQMAALEQQLASLLSTLSEEHPRVKRVRAEINQIASTMSPGGQVAPSNDPLQSMLDIQLADLDGQIAFLEQEIKNTEALLEKLREAIERTPGVAIRLEALTRDYQNVQTQYDNNSQLLATAKAGESRVLLNRDERIAVIERAAPPTRPFGPNRKLVAGGGILAGSALAALFFVLTELLNRSIRRPVDLMRGLGVQPLATIPFLEKESVVRRRRQLNILAIIAVIIAVPLGLWALHTFYLPLDLLAERVLDNIGR